MARKRGGLAGIWDRNKGVIKTLAPIALGAIPGVGVPLAAAAGAAMGGLDRPGKGGIGLDVGGAIKGGISGYAGGKTGKAISSGIKGLLAPKATELSPVDLSGKLGLTPGQAPYATDQAAAFGLGGQVAPVDASRLTANAPMFPSAAGGTGAASTAARATAVAPRIAAPTASASPSAFVAPLRAPAATGPIGLPGTRTMPTPERGAFGRFADFMRENKDVVEMTGKGIMQMMPDQAAQMRAETDRRAQEAQQRYYEFQMQQATEQRQQDEARRRAVLQFLSPYIRQNAPLLNPSAFGMEG